MFSFLRKEKGQIASECYDKYLELVFRTGGLRKMETLKDREKLLLAAVDSDNQPCYLNHLAKTQAMMGNIELAQHNICEWRKSGLIGGDKSLWKSADLKYGKS